mmetsp:Transcript_48871/g.157157  ORF Transcript_48871/g.157157 Transcript_48871/m.157157 type:complete len:86 (-) Transcript_48871:374-631(-)
MGHCSQLFLYCFFSSAFLVLHDTNWYLVALHLIEREVRCAKLSDAAFAAPVGFDRIDVVKFECSLFVPVGRRSALVPRGSVHACI